MGAKPKEPPVLERPLKGKLDELVDDWAKAFCNETLLEGGNEKLHAKLFSTLMAANFLNCEPLRDLCCAKVADMLRGKNEQEILDMFGVTTPFTAEEEEKLYEQYPWLREKPEAAKDGA
eukprot:NODE_2146_length_504_cov_403.092308_g1753_i0.p2 GENE.NODE_2146_length_504_cov_403.092308_g1753_i0~~NODE_2146_length_504_cov_403.092308_g1753_i0.p2  ORF type:complete len:131 (+),score=41.70 NODE_2146_length_504_cov_403.092308_g1753_i0:37-393(+)